MRKTVEIDDGMKALIDRLRIQRGETMKKVVNDALRRGLDEIEEQRGADKDRDTPTSSNG